MTSQTRVVLVKPGDVLIFGNVGDVDLESLDGLRGIKEALGLEHILVFPEDIDLASVPGGA